MEWQDAKNPPLNEDEVIIWWERKGWNSKPSVDMGNYNHTLKRWRPRGCNGNFNDEVTHWMPLPPPPTGKK